MNKRCDRLWEIDLYREQRLAAKAAQSFQRHLRVCANCRTQMERDNELRRLARQLPDCTPGDLPLRRLRARVLRDAAIGLPARAMRGQRWGLAVAAVGVGLAISLIVASYHAPHVTVAAKTQMAKATSASAALVGPGSDAFAGSVEAPSGAHWRQTRERGIERVDLDDGAIRVHVRRQVDGERFLVVLPDGEIEVRGTTFDVNVEHGITTQVDVHEGVVELRIRGRGITRLSTDEAYNAPISTAAIVTAEPTPLAPMTSAPIRIPRRTTHAEDQDIAYAAAVKLLREGRGDEAAAAFHALWLADPHTPQTEDASFLEAVALARQGRVDAAALAAEHHLALFPESFHRKEAAILVARAASQRGDCEKALTMIAPWSNDSLEPNVRGALGPCEGAPR